LLSGIARWHPTDEKATEGGQAKGNNVISLARADAPFSYRRILILFVVFSLLGGAGIQVVAAMLWWTKSQAHVAQLEEEPY